MNGQLLPMYHVMQECWHPIPELRKDPQAVMRDVNLLLYRVFNSKKVHLYATIDGPGDDDTATVNSNGSENGSSSTLKDTVGPMAPLVRHESTIV